MNKLVKDLDICTHVVDASLTGRTILVELASLLRNTSSSAGKNEVEVLHNRFFTGFRKSCGLPKDLKAQSSTVL